MSEVNDIVEQIREIQDEYGFVISVIDDPFLDDMVQRIINNPFGNNYQKFHGNPQFRERTKSRLHGMHKDLRAISHRRKYRLKSMKNYVIKQFNMYYFEESEHE